MKLHYLFIFFPFFNCSTQNKLKIETIIETPSRITSQNTEARKNNPKSNTKRLEHAIFIKNKSNKNLALKLQGNISSGGLSIYNVRKIHLEEGQKIGNSMTLKYNVEILNIPGKESANVKGYNYSKEEYYKIPKDVEIIKVELYEDYVTQRMHSNLPKSKLLVEKIIDLSTKS
ncbi:hypothetical protein [Empedobacter brevis]|uniref:hypothetical protein n=1 Tax=Empedobacter brevis TaxID=247 RepID=UPI0039AECF41